MGVESHVTAMDWQLVTGIGLALIFGLLPYAVKDMPQWITWAAQSRWRAVRDWGERGYCPAPPRSLADRRAAPRMPIARRSTLARRRLDALDTGDAQHWRRSTRVRFDGAAVAWPIV